MDQKQLQGYIKDQQQQPQGYIHDHYSPKLDRSKFGKSRSFEVYTENSRKKLIRAYFAASKLKKEEEELRWNKDVQVNESSKLNLSDNTNYNRRLIKETTRASNVNNLIPNSDKQEYTTKAISTKEKPRNHTDKTGVHVGEHRVKSKYSPPPEVSLAGSDFSADSTYDLKTNNKNNKKLLNFEFDKSSVGYGNAFTMLRVGLKLKERFVLGLSVVAVLFTLLLVIDIQMDYGYAGNYVVPSHGRVRYANREDGPEAAYNSFRKRFLQKTNR